MKSFIKVIYILVLIWFSSYTFANETLEDTGTINSGSIDTTWTVLQVSEDEIRWNSAEDTLTPEQQLKLLNVIISLWEPDQVISSSNPWSVNKKDITSKVEKKIKPTIVIEKKEELVNANEDEEKKIVKVDLEKEKFLKQTEQYLKSVRLSLDIKIREAIYNISQTKKIDPYLSFAQIKKESTFHQESYNSWHIGYLQVGTYPVIWYNQIYWTKYHLSDLYDPFINLEIGLDYLRQKLEIYQSEPLALMAYNWGDGYVKRNLKAWLFESSYTRYINSLRTDIKSISID